MDYEKAYKDAKARMSRAYNSNRCTIGFMNEIFPELAESDDEKIRKWLIGYFQRNKVTEVIKTHDIIAWLEKQGETSKRVTCTQEVEVGNGNIKALVTEEIPIDKVEPKFHEGDWIVDNQGLVHQIERVVENITTHTFGYDIVGGGYFNDESEGVRLWSIQDAKDGDVLYLQHDGKEHIIIYKGIIKERFRIFVSAYCAYNGIVDDFCFADVSKYANIAYGVIMPATKEQRDTLIKAMIDAGYEWDEENKTLKKFK